MTQEELRKIGQLQLQIMDEVHKLCVSNGITYYIVAGTLLGAVRHRGFIPWDLDIDIAMPRQDYAQFQRICSEKLKKPYAYVDHNSFPNYMRPHAMITRQDTVLHLKYDSVNPNNYEIGVYIDIFPLDNAPDDSQLRLKQAKKLKKLRSLKDRRLPYCYSFSPVRRLAHRLVSGLLCWIPVHTLNCRQQEAMQAYAQAETKCICSMASQYAYSKQCMPREIYGKPVLLEFEGRQYYAPEQYKEYLSRLYGDYMQLPPPEKRQANYQIFTALERK